MATNNSLNNNFPSGITATGTIALNGSGAGATNIGSSASGATNFTSSNNSTYTLANKSFTLTTGTGGLNIGTDSTAKTITIGGGGSSTMNLLNSTFVINSTATSTFAKSGNGGFSIVNNGGNISFDGNATGAMGISIATPGATNINIATNAVNIPITLGNGNGTSTFQVNTTASAVAGFLNIGTTGAKTINIGATTGVSTTSIVVNNLGQTVKVYLPFLNITGTSANLIPGLYHIANSGASLCTFTLPTTCPLGSIINITGAGSGLWIIVQNSGQNINSSTNATTVGITGTLASVGQYDSMQIQCVVADTTWVVKSSQGSFIYV